MPRADSPEADSLAELIDLLHVAPPATAPARAPQATSKGAGPKPRKKSLPGKNAIESPMIDLDGMPMATPEQPHFLAKRKKWPEMPDWIVLSDERGKARPFPPLAEDPLFVDGAPALLPYLPPAGTPAGKGAAIVCPGGNLEFLHPREGAPIARWVAEALGVPAFVLRYRLLPSHNLAQMHADFVGAVRAARRHANGGPVVAFGFSAGGYVCASGAAAAASGVRRGSGGGHGGNASAVSIAAPDSEGTPDGLGLIYPCTCPDGWLAEDTCGFWRADVHSEQVRYLIACGVPPSLHAGLSNCIRSTSLIACGVPPSLHPECPPSLHAGAVARAGQGETRRWRLIRRAATTLRRRVDSRRGTDPHCMLSTSLIAC